MLGVLSLAPQRLETTVASTLASAQTTHDPTRRSTTSAAQRPKGFAEKSAIVDGVTIRYTIGGQGPGVVLLHGYAQTSHMAHQVLGHRRPRGARTAGTR